MQIPVLDLIKCDSETIYLIPNNFECKSLIGFAIYSIRTKEILMAIP